MLNDKSEAELNIKADNTTIEVSKDAEVKALIASPIVKIDLYQKGKAIIEGDAASAKVTGNVIVKFSPFREKIG